MLDKLIPALSYLSPYGANIAAFFSNTGSAFAYADATGHVGRALAIISPSSIAGIGPQLQAALVALEKLGIVHIAGATNGTNAYPPPGEIGQPIPFSGHYPRLKPLVPALR